jgi:hypothetical protein
MYHIPSQPLQRQDKAEPTVKNKWTSGWARNWFYYKVHSKQRVDVHEKGTYPLSSVMTPLDYPTEAPCKCGADDVNVVAFTEAAAIIGGRNAVEEFLTTVFGRLAKAGNLRWRG